MVNTKRAAAKKTQATETSIARLHVLHGELVKEYETLQAAGVEDITLTTLGNALNAVTDASWTLEQSLRFVGTDKGDWNDPASRWHY